MTEASSPREFISHKDLFFGLDADQLPSFRRLDSLDFPQVKPDEDLPDDIIRIIERELRPIHHICRKFGYTPLITEFSLISDMRLLGQKAEPHFSSYIAFFLPGSRSVARAYVAALEHMGSIEAGREQIVPHPELFSPAAGLIALDRASIALPAGPGVSPASVEPHLVAIRQAFTLINAPTHTLDDRVRVFIDKLLENVKNDTSLADELAVLDRTLFLLIPFVRPHFQSSALPLAGDLDRERYRGYPAGSLFLFLQPQDSPRLRSKEELAQALSWLLAESSLRESYASHAVEQSWKTYNLAHPLKHRLGALSSNTRWLEESYNAGDTDFARRLRAHRGLVETTYSFAGLCHLLYFALVNGPEATLSAQDAGGSWKFSTAGQLDILKLLTEAAENPAFPGRTGRKLQLNFSTSFAPVVHGFYDLKSVGEAVRLSDELYREIFFELVSNAFRHGSAEDGMVRAYASMQQVNGDSAVILSNAVAEVIIENEHGDHEDDWAPWLSDSPTGLAFVASTLRATGTGALFFRHTQSLEDKNEWQFEVALVLAGLRNDT